MPRRNRRAVKEGGADGKQVEDQDQLNGARAIPAGTQGGTGTEAQAKCHPGSYGLWYRFGTVVLWYCGTGCGTDMALWCMCGTGVVLWQEPQIW